MRVKFKRWTREPRECDLVVLVRSEMSGDDYDTGALEAARATADNCSEALGHLLELLIEREIVGVNDIPRILGMYETEIEEVPE